MSIDIGNLELILVEKLNSSTTPYDILLYTKILKNLRANIIKTIGNFNDLPDLTSVDNGELWFVEGERTIFVPDKRINIWRRLSNDSYATIWTWGLGGIGRLGNNTTVNQSSPVSVVGGYTDWCTVSVGSTNAAAIRTNGTLWTWGNNFCGQLGDNTKICRSSPVSVVGGFTDWCAVSSGACHTAALRTNCTLWTWGCNGQGRLGIDCTVDQSSPVSVVGGFTDWCAVSAGKYMAAAIRTDGTLWSWGCNRCGALGINCIDDQSSPVSVVGGFGDWCAVSASSLHTAAIRTNGTLWTWGHNNNGQLGIGFIGVSYSSPVSVVGGFTDWCAVSVYGTSNAAIRTNCTIWTWGSGSLGVLGNNSESGECSPKIVVGGFTDWRAVSVGSFHMSALRTNGTLWSWGTNANNELADGTQICRSSPVSVVGGFTDWCAISSNQPRAAILKRTYL